MVLKNLGVDQPSGVENDTGSNEFDRFLHFGGFGKTPEAGQQIEWIDKTPSSRDAPHKISPWQPGFHFISFSTDRHQKQCSRRPSQIRQLHRGPKGRSSHGQRESIAYELTSFFKSLNAT
jgi:hypothetical protein